jgi:putative hydrolase of the HAD superfamily
MIRAIAFDLDDTLFAERDYVRSGFHAVANDPLLASHPDFFETAWRLFETGHRHTVFNLALESLSVPVTPELIQALVRIYREHVPAIALFDDADRAMRRLAARYRLGAITDGYHETQRRKVAALQLDGCLDPIVYSDLLGRQSWKPDPLPYRRFMDEAACEGRHCCYVGDNPSKDFVSANRLGWTSVQVVRPGNLYGDCPAPPGGEARWRITSLDELDGVLAC